MSRKLRSKERKLVIKLVGNNFAYERALLNQIDNARIFCVDKFAVYEFEVKSASVIPIPESLLGEGTFRDLDGTPVVVSLLKKDGLLWRLDVNKLNSESVMCCPAIENIRCLGFGRGVSFED